MQILTLLKSLASKNTVIGILVVIVVLAVTDSYNAHQRLKEVQAVYQNPKVVQTVKIVHEKGPVQIKTVIVERPGATPAQAEKVTTITEERGATLDQLVAGNNSSPVSEKVIMPTPRTDRYLVSFGLNRLTPSFDGKALFVGYGINNRFDFQVGGIIKDGFSPWLMATARF